MWWVQDADQVLQCIQRPGETMFIPAGYWHTVLNIKPSVAVTENFAPRVLVNEVLGELQRRPTFPPVLQVRSMFTSSVSNTYAVCVCVCVCV